ncbi:hypothetical protein SISSUDRAFT_998572 [Sistotremastrum suecicum HHB10207 ss-3]|uniref:RING-14 protein n=1 Tax=Sistotremastrum suecicum HHB10207 ss-3 TaxID=1314776 RepID=A0A166HJX9_9AGAM|nr:hypothetical protein SISSUDRAFT_998572 [Sistotremastrum suecicum HHB10207 ss-3]
MHYGKSYSALLASLPPEFQDSAIEYRQLKKTIKKLVDELGSLGLNPDVLNSLLHTEVETHARSLQEPAASGSTSDPTSPSNTSTQLSSELSQVVSKAVYEFSSDESNTLSPRLRIWISPSRFEEVYTSGSSEAFVSESQSSDNPSDDIGLNEEVPQGALTKRRNSSTSLLWALQQHAVEEPSGIEPVFEEQGEAGLDLSEPEQLSSVPESDSREIVISLKADANFFALLTNALVASSNALRTTESQFMDSLKDLSVTISQHAKPPSSHHHPIPSPKNIFRKADGDLYTWREIFTMYMELEIFESSAERDRGDRSTEESEKRLGKFAQQIGARGMKLSKDNRTAFERFLELNVLILNLRKFQIANNEAARKILKKHTKRTGLPSPSSAALVAAAPVLNVHFTSLPHTLVQAMAEILLPIIPHLDDYECLICASVAFKPVRLACGHLFCVRCLVKLQKRGKANCPVCRAETVLQADRTNVDDMLLRYMVDWFPREVKEKKNVDGKEVEKEQMEELGMSNDCTIM